MKRFRLFLRRVDRVLELAEAWLVQRAARVPDAESFAHTLAFRWDGRSRPGRLLPIHAPHVVDLDDLVGVDRPIERLVRNTQQFVRGLPANHVLLYGERGTGKSSAVSGLLGRFGGRGLRLVEVRKEDLLQLPEILATLRDVPYRFLLFCDDLSFDEGEAGYRELKASLEGSLESPPPNVRIVATSNRRHLIPERVRDNQEAHLDEAGELHMGEALEEKLALSDRFGLLLGFYGFDQETYLEIVARYAAKTGIDLPQERLRGEALRFALARSSRSGRTARQFVDDLAGRLALERDA